MTQPMTPSTFPFAGYAISEAFALEPRAMDRIWGAYQREDKFIGADGKLFAAPKFLKRKPKL